MPTVIFPPDSVAVSLTPVPVLEPIVTAVAGEPASVDSAIVPTFVWPEPLGTAPKLRLTGSRAARAFNAESTLSRPAPIRFGSEAVVVAFDFSTPWSAVFTIADRICAADQFGCAPTTTAAEPARCGVAIEVPWKN